MSANLSKNDLLAIFEEIKNEQATQFPLSERFINKLFRPNVLAKGKEYYKNGKITWLEHTSDFSVVDSTVLGDNGTPFNQRIEISKLPTGYSVDTHCTCNIKTKCRHLAAILLKLKIEHSGEYGEDYFINDWFSELSALKSAEQAMPSQVLLFVLDIENNKVFLSPKIANYDKDQNYTLGRNLTDQQLNSFITPNDLLESDFRLYSWIRSQNAVGSIELKGQWGFNALQQLIATERLFLQRSRVAIKPQSGQALSFKWQQEKDLTQLGINLEQSKSWALLKTTPPTYIDLDHLKIGRIRTPLSADEISHLQTMPALHSANFDRIYKQLADNFGAGVIPHPTNSQTALPKAASNAVLKVTMGERGLTLSLLFKYKNKNYLAGEAHASIINNAFENTVTNELVNLGFEFCKGGLQSEFVFTKQSPIHLHWLTYEVLPSFKERGWKVTISKMTVANPQSEVTLYANRAVGHQMHCKVILGDAKAALLFTNEDLVYQSLNRQSELFHYYPVGRQFGVINKSAINLLCEFKQRFEFVKTRDEFNIPLSYLPELVKHTAINVELHDDSLELYLQELNNTDHTMAKVSLHGLNDSVELREYQQQGVDWLSFLKRHKLGGILADDMGLGKTLQVIAFLTSTYNRPQAGPTLIVCPTSLVSNWQNEITKFAKGLKVTTIFGSHRNEPLQHLAQSQCILTTYPLLKRDIAYYSPLYFENIILDEAQYIKNDTAQVSRLVKRLNAEFKLCLSGTPIENNLLELKSLLDFAMPSLLGSQAHFKQHFQTPIEREADIQRAEQLKALIMPFIMRRTKAQVAQELPEKTELTKEFEFEPKQKEMYQGITQALEEKLIDLFAEQGVQKSKLAFLEALLKLRQICCHPKLIEPDTQAGSAKLEWLATHLPLMLSLGRKVIIFSQFTSALDLIAKRLEEINIDFSLLTGQTRHRDKVIDEFTSGKTSVFLISLKAGGTGLNLTQADTVIHFDPWWNPAVEKQATDRAYRIGQTNPVFVYKLIMSNSIEQKVFKMQEDKQALVDALFTDKSMSFTQFDEQQMLSLIKN
ncbi:DEAD/DEAH box helicase [Pseudoalteromonas sp. SG45-5]|uniref:DEAD/DEAH box helicase n=1 Tax=unclassified Pseudoalteromonas TaxID=194690 RepID=UPI0015F868FD|nr:MULTISPECIES: DEAD/DEAH box helicase [unclassified Pseudoalteromonas]MBB1387445.1 DEAD/DEAH box helicase [Pseudoalteromonas sp. SG45-5]MBB1394439.1 DEAD/DEAH box helicase [Pseudoalteromonas sp. SG44-4]MBB1446491.1 DEAD/DEAH box helicase [Pseudoalteromonas sp. SG41-6]